MSCGPTLQSVSRPPNVNLLYPPCVDSKRHDLLKSGMPWQHTNIANLNCLSRGSRDSPIARVRVLPEHKSYYLSHMCHSLPNNVNVYPHMFSEFIPIPKYMKLISELKGMGRRIQISNNHLTLINTSIVVIQLSYEFLLIL